ncbi:sigma-70 family RNA polymerase sigma factor [Enterococcus pseudoavium]|uniref:Sigma-70 family RNA polymerase sigma factor n=2 Tax=Enterococcus TaxID=1350 RepID=A0ABU3FHH6_9ENTE|nr:MULTISPECIES: sigma-70 family RNA polymerase sigma factor [Enterococcus]MDT2595621.1 sigma-70 family RNA polymerase sigma factor [Enterococcus dongliensis]MDT2641199.1 sigma-70 family RNA polymerase sigma factor [Enterococcus dongliensis]MDT2646432.1 sigma-70 family RNA polymerase sigma factor [Enterococcus dongliensis]MDT2669135.1 sigma-70 family RNA polymerase sigma factor [Enterococcus dongliensis]MDT2770509.1 sigma-70 family RNA polymerase sigma factor [Enterococcus pseudoavium]
MSIDQELFDLNLCLQLNEKELARWSNYADTDGDLAKHQTFLTSLEKQARLKEEIIDLNQRIERLEKERDEIVQMVDKFKGLDQQILKLKYIDGLTLEAIADETGYTYQYIRSRHAEIMRIIRFSKIV